MNRQSTPKFATEQLVKGVRLRLPPRSTQNFGVMRFIAVFLTLFGLVFAGVGITFAVTAEGSQALIAIPFALAGLVPLLIGSGLSGSHTYVDITSDEVRVVDRLGLLRWSRRRLRSTITKVYVKELEVRVNHRPVHGIGTAVLETVPGRHLMVGLVYRTETLQPFANALAEELDLATEGEDVTVVPMEDAMGELRGPVPEQPPTGSKATVQHNRVGLVLTLPAVGFKGIARILATMGIMFMGIPLAILVVTLTSTADAPPIVFFIVPPIFATIGAAILTTSIVLARRHALIAIVDGSLLIKRIRPFFGIKTHEWARSQVGDIAVINSNTRVNNRPLQQLHIEGQGMDGDTKLWTGRNADELQWIAAVLRKGLGIGEAEAS